MNDPSQLPDFNEWSIAERILVVEQIWDSIANERLPLPLTLAQQSELDRRLEALRESPNAGFAWQDVRARIQAKK